VVDLDPVFTAETAESAETDLVSVVKEQFSALSAVSAVKQPIRDVAGGTRRATHAELP
jgi:hypothetical protein